MIRTLIDDIKCFFRPYRKIATNEKHSRLYTIDEFQFATEIKCLNSYKIKLKNGTTHYSNTEYGGVNILTNKHDLHFIFKDNDGRFYDIDNIEKIKPYSCSWKDING